MKRLIASVVGKLRDLVTEVLFGTGRPGGIDDEALPSGFRAPYKRGSRHVRNLSHIDF